MVHLTPQEVAYMRAHASDDIRVPHIIANVVCLAVAALAVLLRLMSRRIVGKKLAMDDALIGIALLLLAGHAACNIICFIHFGMGRHVIFVTDVKGFLLTIIVAQILYTTCLLTTKISILTLYHRIFPQKWFKHVLVGLGVFLASYTIAQTIAQALRCVPMRSLWEMDVPGKCISLPALIIVSGIVTVVSDFIILGLPIPALLKLQLGKGRASTKYVLITLFSMGGFACIVSIVRLVYANKTNTNDPSWDATIVSTLSTVELSVAIIAACMPTYRPLFNFIRHGNFRSLTGSGASHITGSRSRFGRGGTSQGLHREKLHSSPNVPHSSAVTGGVGGSRKSKMQSDPYSYGTETAVELGDKSSNRASEGMQITVTRTMGVTTTDRRESFSTDDDERAII